MADEVKRIIVFTSEWIDRNLTGLLRHLRKGYSLFSSLALLKDPILPIRWIEVETIAKTGCNGVKTAKQAAKAHDVLTEDEQLVYFAVSKARTPDYDKMKIHRRPGAPTKKTTKTAGYILEALEAGLSQPAAAGYAGICPATLYSWMKESEEFLKEVEYAEALGQARLELNIIRGTIDNPEFALKVAERLYKEYVPKRQVGADKNFRKGMEAVAEALVAAGIEEEKEDG